MSFFQQIIDEGKKNCQFLKIFLVSFKNSPNLKLKKYC